MVSEQRVPNFENAGASSSSEKKRVRVALLRNYKPFLSEIDQLAASLKFYENGPDSAKRSLFEKDWQVKVEFEPGSLIERASQGENITSFLETLSQQTVAEIKHPMDDPPVCLFWDNKYQQASLCVGEPLLDLRESEYTVVPVGVSLNEAIKLLKAAGIKNRKGYLTNTDEAGLVEAIQVLQWHVEEKMSIPDMVRKRYPSLGPETFKSKSTRYAKLLKQMMEIIDPPDRPTQQK